MWRHGGWVASVMFRRFLALFLHPFFLPRSSDAMFYAVRRGRKTGVFHSWEECKEQVDKYKSASFKKFATREDALDFINGESTQSSSHSTDAVGSSGVTWSYNSYHDSGSTSYSSYRSKKRPNEQTSDNQYSRKRVKYTEVPCASSGTKDTLSYMGDHAVVYTDGCCSGNGFQKARAGVGVYWGPGHPLNTSERLPGRQTNQRAEIHAACKAIEQAKSQDIKKLAIYTDSKFTINGMTSWVPNWKTNGWRTSAGKDVINKEDFERLAELSEGIDIQWMHVPGHAGYTGNEAADRLAKEGAGMFVS